MGIQALLELLKQPVLDASPEIWTDKQCLYVRTSKAYRLLSLFFYSRLVIANRIEKHIEIIVTTFWFYKSKEYIQFNDIEYIDMSVREITNDQGWSLDLNEKTGFGGRNPTQIYYVQARCKSSSYPLNLCRFVDQGIWNLGGFGIYLNDSGTESEGPQKKRADNYAELLSDYTGVELWSNRQVQFAFGQDNLRKCNKCGHEIRLSATICTYCGYEDSSIVNG